MPARSKRSTRVPQREGRAAPPATGTIARLWHGVVPSAKGDTYARYLRETGVKDCRATPGNRGVQILRRTAGETTHFVFISLWASMDAIRGFAGADVERARYYPADRDYLLELEPTVTHYEVDVVES